MRFTGLSTISTNVSQKSMRCPHGRYNNSNYKGGYNNNRGNNGYKGKNDYYGKKGLNKNSKGSYQKKEEKKDPRTRMCT